MPKTKELSEFAIASKIRRGGDFVVMTERERKRALTAAKYLGADVTTRALPKGGFRIFVPSEIEN